MVVRTSKDYFEGFQHEAGLHRRLKHENIVNFIGIYFGPSTFEARIKQPLHFVSSF